MSSHPREQKRHTPDKIQILSETIYPGFCAVKLDFNLLQRKNSVDASEILNLELAWSGNQ